MDFISQMHRRQRIWSKWPSSLRVMSLRRVRSERCHKIPFSFSSPLHFRISSKFGPEIESKSQFRLGVVRERLISRSEDGHIGNSCNWLTNLTDPWVMTTPKLLDQENCRNQTTRKTVCYNYYSSRFRQIQYRPRRQPGFTIESGQECHG